jgi:hypothetical protein
MAASLGTRSVGRKPKFREDLSPEAEEQTLLEAVTRKRLLTDSEHQTVSCSEL